MALRSPRLRSLTALFWAAIVSIGLGWQWHHLEGGESAAEATFERDAARARRPRPDEPQGFATFRRMQMVDEAGVIPADGLMRASAQAAALHNASAAVRNAAGISRASWTWIGPGNIGGRIRGLAIDPTSPSTLFAGSVGGGIWKTTNSGASWAPVDDFMANLAVSCIVFQPGTPATLYAGTGEGFYNGDRIQGAGIFRSTDSGRSWQQLTSTTTPDFFYVNRIAMSADGSIILAATARGLFRSTDAGGSWTKVLTGSYYPDLTDVDFMPGSSTLAVASGYNRNAYSSSNGGANWTAASGLTSSTNFNRVELGEGSGGTVYALVDMYYTTGRTSTGTQLWRSTNNGQTFSQVTTSPGGYLSGQGWYDSAIWVSPTDPETLVVGGLDLHRSTDGGATFTKISTWFQAPFSAHADHHVIVGDPGYNGTTNARVYFGNDGGVYKADNVLEVTSGIRGGFTSLNNNLGVTQFYGAAGNTTSGKIIGGTQDNGTLLYTSSGGAGRWTTTFGGDGGYSAADPSDSNYLYGEYVYLALHRSRNGGASGEYIYYLGGSCESHCIADAWNGTANFIAPFVLDPSNPNRLLAGGASLWRSNDVKTEKTSTTGPTWTSIKPHIGGSAVSSSFISTIAVAPGNSDVIAVGHNNGNVYVTTNGTSASPTWTRVDGTALPNKMVTRLAIDPGNANVIFATFGGFSANNVWKSVTLGASWTLSTGSGAFTLPNAPVYSLVIHPADSNRVFVGTEVGIFASTDAGATWSTPHDGPANVSIDELFFMGGSTIVAASHGRGLFTSTFGDARMSLDAPGHNSTATSPFVVSGWALDRGAWNGTGVDAVHVYAYPNDTGRLGSGAFLGEATTGLPRDDVAAVFGARFANAGYALAVPPTLLPSGRYRLIAYGRSTVAGGFTTQASSDVTVNGCEQMMSLDTPRPGATTGASFSATGWAMDRCSTSGSGVDAVHVYAFPSSGPGIFLGLANYGLPRPDVGGIFGTLGNNSGFALTASGLTAGTYRIVAYAHSQVSGAFNQSRFVDITVASRPDMSMDQPAAGSIISAGQPFVVAGWALDRAAADGSGVDAIHIYAYPLTGGVAGHGVFLGASATGGARPDVGAAFGVQFGASGYRTQVSIGLAGRYRIVAYAKSRVSGSFNQQRSLDITVR